MKKILILPILIIVVIFIVIFLNPTMKDFKDFTPTPIELVDELKRDSYNFKDHVYGLDYKRIHNYLIYSVYEFQYFVIKKNRTKQSYHYKYYDGNEDRHGVFFKTDTLIKINYIGFLKNFYLSDN